MTNAAPSSSPSSLGFFARVWAMLARLMGLMFASEDEITAHFAEIDAELARAMLAKMKADDPSLADLPEGAIRTVWRGGRLDFEWALEAAPRPSRADWLRFITIRRQLGIIHRFHTLRGARFPRHGTERSRVRFERRNARRRRISAMSIAAVAPHVAPTPIHAPP